MSEQTDDLAARRAMRRREMFAKVFADAEAPGCVGPPIITFGVGDGNAVIFRDQAALDHYEAEVRADERLNGWVPFGTHIDIDCRLEFSEPDEAEVPRWERVVGPDFRGDA